MKQLLFVLTFAASLCLPVFAQGAAIPAASGPGDSASAAPEYIIGPEDVLSINVWREAELTQTVIVRPDGKIGLPLLNDVQASGLTTSQLRESITNGIREFVATPIVTVVVSEIRSQVVYVMGSVGKPGTFLLGSPTSIIELLAKAGGPTEFAKPEETQIIRKEGAATKRIKFNLKTFIDGRDYQQNIQLRPGDIVIVP